MFSRTQSFVRAIPLFTLVTVIVAVTGCSSGSSPGGSGSGGFESALSRVADTASNRTQITYDNTSELVRLAGKSPVTRKGFADLRGWGVPTTDLAFTSPGYDLYSEDYGVSAGAMPQSLSLMAGGQNSAQITSRLTGLGWKRSGGKLIGPPPLKASADTGVLALNMAQVQTAGSDLVFGGPRASLGLIGSPQGATLASDPTISALAQCLGNVVAAGIFTGANLGGKNPAAVAVGVSQPASNTATPHAVACVSWPTQAAAAHFATELRKALSGLSPTLNEPYSVLLKHATLTTVGGSHNVVEWQADTPRNAMTVFQMVQEVDLPALPNCSRLTPAQRAAVTGCT